jgi:hypothetical protein
MLDRPKGVQFGDKPRHRAAGRALILRPQRPPETGEEIKAVYRLVKPQSGVGAQ